MSRALFVLVLFPLSGCFGDESVSAYGAADQTWQLQELDGQPFVATATLTFPDPKTASGNAPCNSYSARFDAPYPWFEVGPIALTKRACPDLDTEQEFFAALGEMTISEVSGGVLVLSNEAGREMVFKAAD